ncbi:MAG: PorV/PorQ family protein [Candidatus Hatepunaea meridiana]|nr:PorV/PorQ family protein [Candidatus Hatepunaea meridiana]
MKNNNINYHFRYTTVHKTLSIVVLLMLLLTVCSVQASEVQKVGTTSMQSLKVATSVRAIGMGETYCALADDIQSVFWNPAGLIYIKDAAVVLSQINMPADIQYNNIAIAKKVNDNQVFGVHLLAMTTGDMPVRTIFRPEGTGENFMCYDIVAGVSWAQRITDRFAFGLNGRIVTSSMADVKYTGMLADIGTMYQTALRSLKIGMSVQNFGPDIDYEDTYPDYRDQGRRARPSPNEDDYTGSPPPTIYRLGLSANFFDLAGITRPEGFDALMAFEMSHPNDNRERINFGMELNYLNTLFLRGGYKFRYKNLFGYDEERWTAGMGMKIPIPGEVDFAFDYAYMDFGRIAEAADSFMGNPHRFSIGLTF